MQPRRREGGTGMNRKETSDFPRLRAIDKVKESARLYERAREEKVRGHPLSLCTRSSSSSSSSTSAVESSYADESFHPAARKL